MKTLTKLLQHKAVVGWHVTLYGHKLNFEKL